MFLSLENGINFNTIATSFSHDISSLVSKSQAVINENDFFWKAYHNDKEIFNGQKPVSLFYNKSSLISKGYIDSIFVADNKVTINFRNLASLLVDSSLKLPYQEKVKVSIYQIVTEIASLYGLKVFDYSKNAKTTILDKFSYVLGTTAFRVLDEITSYNDIILTTDVSGNLILDPQNKQGTTVLLKDVTKRSFVKKNVGIYGKYEIHVSKENDKGEVKEDSKVVTDDGGNDKKVFLKRYTEQGSTIDPSNFAQHEKRMKRMFSETFLVKTSNILQDGKILSNADTVSFRIGNLAKTLRIKSIIFSTGFLTGESATYELYGAGAEELSSERDSEVVRHLKNDT